MAQSRPMSKHGQSTPKPAPISGTFSPAPAGAPHQTSQPLQPQALADMQARARQNERELKPLVFETAKGVQLLPQTEAPAEPGPDTVAEGPHPEGVVGAGTEEGPGDVATLTALEEAFAATPVRPVVDQGAAGVRRPAESDTDSPSRGQPRPSHDPGKQVTGGWGDGGPSGQYYALDGLELQNVITVLMADLRAQVARDLRFGIAAVYPQVRVKVTITLDGASGDAQVNDVKFDVATARILALEATVSDDESTPADAIRDQAGLDKPRKQSVQAGATRIMVDVPHKGAGA